MTARTSPGQQMSIFDLPIFRQQQHSNRMQFLEFHAAHPEVYELFKQFAERALNAGHKKFSARTIIHGIRWETAVNPQHDGGYKINDHHSPYYARKLMSEDSRFAQFFETREIKA